MIEADAGRLVLQGLPPPVHAEEGKLTKEVWLPVWSVGDPAQAVPYDAVQVYVTSPAEMEGPPTGVKSALARTVSAPADAGAVRILKFTVPVAVSEENCPPEDCNEKEPGADVTLPTGDSSIESDCDAVSVCPVNILEEQRVIIASKIAARGPEPPRGPFGLR